MLETNNLEFLRVILILYTHDINACRALSEVCDSRIIRRVAINNYFTRSTDNEQMIDFPIRQSAFDG